MRHKLCLDVVLESPLKGQLCRTSDGVIHSRWLRKFSSANFSSVECTSNFAANENLPLCFENKSLLHKSKVVLTKQYLT